MAKPTFPADVVPSEPAAARLLGLYPQRQQGLWLQRVRIEAGRLSGPQWAALARIARELADGEPLHLTTRQDVEIHNLPEQAVGRVQHLLAEAGLTGVGGCGDTVRNVTVCPCSGRLPGSADLVGLGRQITALLQAQPGAFALPRKFKVSLSACPAGCGQPWINDLGLVAEPAGDTWRFRAVLAGSLGARPATGLAHPRLFEPAQVLPLTLAALRVFAVHGDRQRRGQARLRHVRQRIGDEAFLAAIDEQFAVALAERDWPEPELAPTSPALPARRSLRFDDGNVPIEAAQSLARLADWPGVQLAISNHHHVVAFAAEPQRLDEALAAAGLAGRRATGPRLVVCPGSRWCARAVAETGVVAAALRDRLAGGNAGNVLVAISGCPNGCAHSGVADVGLVGVATAAGQAWNLLIGGDGGLGPQLARPLANRLSDRDAAEKVGELLAHRPSDEPSRG